MPRLIHLNGPPGIGKSTVAERYAAEHPGTLLVDIDRLRTTIGGWQGDFVGTGELVRPVAQAMIGAHLSRGHDVVMPQFLSDPGEVEEFERLATEAGGHFVEVVLMDDADVAIRRFTERTSTSDDPLVEVIANTVEQAGGEGYLRQLHQELTDLQAIRGGAILVQSIPGDEAATYGAVAKAIASLSA